MTTHIFRSVGLALALAGCAGPVRPAVGPALSSLPDEPEQREEQLASAAARPSPETGRASSSEAQQAESAAAGLAAFLGMLFSSSTNAFVGFSVPIEETPRPRVERAEPTRTAGAETAPRQAPPSRPGDD